MARSTRRAHAVAGKENQTSRTTSLPSGKRARHRLSIAELARLEDVFKRDTHPSRQQKKDLAAQLGMDYKTITIWFQNKRQTLKRALHPVERSDSVSAHKADSSLRTVSSPSHNATLDAPSTPSSTFSRDKPITPREIAKIKPLVDSSNAVRFVEKTDDASEIGSRGSQNLSDIIADVSAEPDRPDQIAEHGQIDGTPKMVKWKRARTLEWACEHQAKRRRSSREGHVRPGSEGAQGHTHSDALMDTALSLLSLASSTSVGNTEDVIWAATTLLNFKHSWSRK